MMRHVLRVSEALVVVAFLGMSADVYSDPCNCKYKASDKVCSDGWDPTAWCQNKTNCVGEGAQNDKKGTTRGEECFNGGGSSDHCVESNPRNCLIKFPCVVDGEDGCKSGTPNTGNYIMDGLNVTSGGTCVENSSCVE